MIIVISNIMMCLLYSVLFFIIGVFCQHYCHSPLKRKQQINQHAVPPAPTQEKEGTPLYQEIQDVEFQQNSAYIAVQK